MQTLPELEARFYKLDKHVKNNKAMGLEISTKLALDWWDAATTLRDAREAEKMFLLNQRKGMDE